MPLCRERCYLEERNMSTIRALLNVLQPTAELNALITFLFGIEDRAKLYYISGGKTSGGGDE